MMVPMIIKIGNLMMFQKSSKGLNTCFIPGEFFLYALYFYRLCTHFCRLGMFTFFRSPPFGQRATFRHQSGLKTLSYSQYLRGGINPH